MTDAERADLYEGVPNYVTPLWHAVIADAMRNWATEAGHPAVTFQFVAIDQDTLSPETAAILRDAGIICTCR